MDFQLIVSGWDRVLESAIAASPSGIRIVCPFIKKSAASRFLKAVNPGVIQVITRFNLQDFCDGASDIASLRMLLEQGAKIRGVLNLHAKLYLFAHRRVIVTSANLTEAALLRNHEFGFVAEEPAIVDQCRQYFDDLWRRAGTDLAATRLCDWEQKVMGVQARGSRPSESKDLPDEGANVGITALPIIDPPLVMDAPQSFVKFFGVSTNRADLTTSIRDEVSRSGCHWACTYPRDKRPRQVEDGAVRRSADFTLPVVCSAPA